MSDIKEILKERGNVHGEFADNADISQELKKTVRRSVRWGTMSAVQREAVDNVLQKIARLCSGDPDYEDHWVDIIGYTTLSKDRLPGPKDLVRDPNDLPPIQALRERFQKAIEASKDAPPSCKIKHGLNLVTCARCGKNPVDEVYSGTGLCPGCLKIELLKP